MWRKLLGLRTETAAPEAAPPRASAGVVVGAFGVPAHVGAQGARSAASRVARAGDAPLAPDLSWAALVLAGERAGDVVRSPDGRNGLPPGTPVLLDGARGAGEEPFAIPREALAGTPFPGVTGARALAATHARVVLRLGPPPAARWAVTGLRSVAVFTGRLTLLDGEEAFDVRVGEAALVADPSAELLVLAGNDAAVAVGFAEPGLSVRLR